MRLRLGLAALSNRHFDLGLVPVGTLHAEYLPRYAARFDCLELAETLHQSDLEAQAAAPLHDRVIGWRDQAPPGFHFMPKLHKGITHQPVGDATAAAEAQLAFFEPLGDHLGPVLAQFPPSLAWSLDAAETIRRIVSLPGRWAVEVRHPSWFRNDFHDLLVEAGACLVWSTHHKAFAPDWPTTDWGYVRFVGRHHARGARRAVRREERIEDLLTMRERLLHVENWGECFVIVTNTWEGNAIDSLPQVAAALGMADLAARLQRPPGVPLLADPPR